MRPSTLPWRMDIIFPLTVLLHVLCVLAGPAINVALRASFPASPFLLELLETAALENSSSYFPLLDRIADGAFVESRTDEELFHKFCHVLQDDGHIRDAEALSSFKFALALHAAAPRIEAHYQYYATSVEPKVIAAQDAVCPVWVHFEDKQYCSSSLERAQQDIPMKETVSELPFDRILNHNQDDLPSILYADITHPLFAQFHETVSKTAREGRTSYRVRYRPPGGSSRKPLYVNGYGVELALKRTDYIVIDDREASAKTMDEGAKHPEAAALDAAPAQLQPLTTSELGTIGLNSGSFVMSSADPLDTLLQVSADFPRYSALIAQHNATTEFVEEYKGNRAVFLPQGYNILWINGLQVEPRHINAFSLLNHLKKERTLVNQLRDVGFSASEGMKLLSHPEIAQGQTDDEPQRYDWRDTIEGGRVIMWLNDIEKDKRYEEWPPTLVTLLQRTWPGQLPMVRRDIHNLIIPVDLANAEDLDMIVDTLQSFVKRKVPIRFGLVPILRTTESFEKAKLAYHILDNYGLSTLMRYLQSLITLNGLFKSGKPNFETAIEDRVTRANRTALTYEEVITSRDIEDRLASVKSYLRRLALDGKAAPFLINGVALSRNDQWLEAMSGRVTLDLRAVQRGVMEDMFPESTWIPDFFLFQASTRRNPLIVPEDPKSVKVMDVGALLKTHLDVLEVLPRLEPKAPVSIADLAHLLVVADFDSEHGKALLSQAISAQSGYPGLTVLILHNPHSPGSISGDFSSKLYDIFSMGQSSPAEMLRTEVLNQASSSDQVGTAMTESAAAFWRSAQTLTESLGLAPGETGLWLNGRMVYLPERSSFSAADFGNLIDFERSKRITAVTTAIADLGLEHKVARALALARITSLVARAHVSDVPEGIFESSPLLRTNKFELWNSTHTSIHTSNSDDPAIQIVAAIDPASELAQRWLPIIATLSDLSGVDMRIYLNPKTSVAELPIKRFYRQVIDSTPRFDSDGLLHSPKASFTGISGDALLNLGMDVPPSWLVAPADCIHDLDNIKLNNLPVGENIDAIYELENILIEGHSRDMRTNTPPRGVQLLLGTEKNPHFADTIIMANLGYFQFKANPGYWRISLQPGRSSKIFNLDSVGSKGYVPQPGDNTSSIALLSFQGATLYPRLSRKPGMESEDVLEADAKPGSAMDYLHRGASFASSALSSIGLKKSVPSANADINIFSVASGHLYERMLNIMMLSVLKNTSHTVKFWFIEQFLSSSFKSFVPHLAAHYGFQYEMVTYKWPHWLRGQKEKQREIWGYKILFLDVLFPLSLEKVIFVDADQIVRTDMMELNRVDLQGAVYGFTPMCDSRTEMEGFRFWKQGYWKNYLQGKPYHISALFVVDLKKFREVAAGDRLRQQYQALSADPASLSNLDQDLPNHMQHTLPIFSLPQEWLWCETWCDDQSLRTARTIDLCNNPLTKEPKLERARRQVPEWTVYDEEAAEVARRVTEEQGQVEDEGEFTAGNLSEQGGLRKKDEL